jgi:hypothetical protein
MAQTRAQNRSLRASLMQIVELAGYQSTPAEEMPDDSPPPEPEATTSKVAPVAPSKAQWAEIRRLIGRLAELRPATDWRARAEELAGVPARMLTGSMATGLTEKLAASLEAVEEFDAASADEDGS